MSKKTAICSPSNIQSPRPVEAHSDRFLSRRRFLITSASAAGVLALPATLSCNPQHKPAAGRRETNKPAEFLEQFTEPPVEFSTGGKLSTTFRVVEADIAIREPSGVRIERTRCYNGQATGPTLRARPGDEIRIRLVNELPRNPDSPCGREHLNHPHCFNTTNLHTHGLHVSPRAPSDDSFLRIEPQTEYQFCLRVPSFHPAGTFWYHAHVHGSTALQVMNGLVGALIIEEPDDRKIVPGATDFVWVIQQIVGRGAEKLYTCDHVRSSYTVNGKYRPALSLRPDEVQRWRFINATATPGGYMNLQLINAHNKPQEMTLIALDGYNLRRMQRRTEYVLPPGGRADFLVRLSTPGVYKMMERRYQGQSEDQELAVVRVSGKSAAMRLPAGMPSLSPFQDPITDEEIGSRRRTLRFQICPDQARGDTCKHFPEAKPCSGERGNESIRNAFLIDGKLYDPERIDQSVKLGTAEEWEIVNETAAEHPFHIHTNHFQVVQKGVSPNEWPWRDTISLPANSSVRIRTRFRTYDGRFLLHCHILLHSDLGMMQNVEVVGPGIDPCKPA